MDMEFKTLTDSFSNVDNLDNAALVLSSFLKYHRKYINPKSSLLSPDACRSMLSQNAELYALLSKAHRDKDFSELGKNLPLIPQVGWESRDELQTVKNILDEVLRDDKIECIVQGEEPFEIWRAQREEGTIAAHIEGLGIPNFKTDYPCTVMHRLGSFVLHPSLKERLSNIFSLHHTFLVNASGTGKTRLLLEGLCAHWGFYFTSVVDSSGLGSEDVYSAIHFHVPLTHGFNNVLSSSAHVEEARNTNLRIVHRRFSETLLSRLLVFKIFLECATPGRLTHEHKKRWLLAQLRPEILGIKDVFVKIQHCLMESGVADDVIENAIVQTLQETSCMWDLMVDEHFYVVLDEANHAATSLPVAFREDGRLYPVLKEIIRSWLRHLEHLPISFIVAGTGVPRKHFQTRTDEWDNWIWCSNTGAFDNEEDQRAYIQTILPPEILALADGKALVERMWKWFRGRHRLTAAFLTILLQNDFRDMHSHLDEQVYAATRYKPDEAEYNTRQTSFRGYHEVSLEILRYSDGIRSMMHEALIHAILHFDGRRNLGDEGVRVVAQSQAHFLDPDMSNAVVDEPIMLTATAKWFMKDARSITDLEYFNSAINLSECREIHRIDYVALYLALALDGTRNLSDVLNFSNVPAWAKKSAKLVVCKGLSGKAPVRYSSDSPHQLVAGADTLAGVLEWMDVNEHEVPFCSYTSDARSTLIFAVELGRGSRVWVVLQTPSEDGAAVDVEAVLQNLGVENIFRVGEDSSSKESDDILQTLKKLPNLQSNLGPHGVLGVIASLKKKINFTSPTISAVNEQPVAVVNLELMERLSKERSQQELFDRLIFSFKKAEKRKDSPIEKEPVDEEPPPSPKRGRKKKGKAAAAETTELPSGLESNPEEVEPLSVPKRGRKKKEKLAPETSSGSRTLSGSESQPVAERRYNLRSSTLNKRRATK